MLGRLNKKDLAVRVKKMKAAAQASLAKDLKLKTVAEVVPSDDEETYFGSVFKRRQKVVAKLAEHFERSFSSSSSTQPSSFPRHSGAGKRGCNCTSGRLVGSYLGCPFLP